MENSNENEVKTLKQMEEEAQEVLNQVVEPGNPLKKMFVDYVGEKLQPENGAVTVEMCVLALAEEFPEFLAPVCEQNFMLGYVQCEKDIEAVMRAHQAATEETVDD